MRSKKSWVVLTQFWLKYGQTQTLAGFVHMRPKFGLKQPSTFLSLFNY